MSKKKTTEDAYAAFLTKAKTAHDLHMWVESFEYELASAEEENEWALIRYAVAASAYYFARAVKRQIEHQEGEAKFANAQLGIDMMGYKPGNTASLKAAVAQFLETRPEFDDAAAPSRDAKSEDAGDLVQGDVGADEVLELWARAEPDRGLPPVEVVGRYAQGHTRPVAVGPQLGWDAGDRVVVHKWCETVIGGDEAPKPEAVAVHYLEDMDLETSDGRNELLWTVLGVVVEDVHEEGSDDHVDSWGDDLWEEVLEWARTAHRIDRGEALDPIDLPAIFAPVDDAIEALVEFFSDTGEGPGMMVGGMEGLLAEEVVANSYALDLVLRAFEACGSIERYEDGLRGTEGEFPAAQFLEAVAFNIGGRRYAFDDLERPEGATVDPPPPADSTDDAAPAETDPHQDDVDASAGVDASADVNVNAEN